MHIDSYPHWYKLRKTDKIDTPALVVYPDRIRHNIKLVKGMIDDVNRLRPHVKTHKTKEITQLLLDASIRKFKCATIAEAEMLGECGAPDVLLAYPLYGAKLQRFARLVQRFPKTRFSALVDHVDGAKNLSATARLNRVKIDVFVDLNVGMGRTGILPDDAALELYRLCSKLDGLHIQGFHAYDGHVREIDITERKKICDRNFQPIARLIDRLLGEGFEKPRVVIGGSPSFPVYAQYPEVECSPGTFVLWDKGYADTLPEQHFLPAAVLMIRVVSLPSDHTICVDLGYKAIASENPLDKRVFFLDVPHLLPVGHSEEHLVLDAGKSHRFKVGDILYALPVHICPTVALYDKLLVAEEGEITGVWEVVARRR